MDRNPFFFCGFCESKSLQFKAISVCAAINCEYLQPSPPTPVRAPWPRGHPYVNPGLLEPGCVLCVTPNWCNFRDTFTIFALILTSADPGTGHCWQGVSQRPMSDRCPTPDRHLCVCVGGTAHRRGHESVKMCNCRHELIRQSSSRTLSTRGRTRTATQTEIRGGQRGRVWRSFRIVPIA